MTGDDATRPPLDHTSSVGRAALGVAAALRAALDELLPHEAIGVRSLGRALGVGRTLAWQCHRMAYSTDLDGVLSAVLGERGIARTLDALANRGVSEDRREQVRAAWDHLAETMREHRIDRDSLRAMTAGVGDSGFADLEALRVRRAAQRGNAQLWGIGVRATIATQLFVPAGDSLDLAALLLHDGLRTFAEIGPLRIHAGIAPGGGPVERPRGEALTGATGSSPLVEDLCTPGSIGTSLVVADAPAGAVDLEPSRLAGTSIRIAVGEILRRVGSPWAEEGDERERGELGDEAFMRFPVGLPTETLVLLLGRHRSLPRWRHFELRAKSASCRDPGTAPDGPGRPIPIDGPIVAGDAPTLPPSLADLAAPNTTLLARGAEALGSSLEDFAFTCAIVEYPVMTAAIRLQWRLPKRVLDRDAGPSTR